MKRDVRNFILTKSAINNSTFVELDNIKAGNSNRKVMSFLAFGDYDAVYTYKINETHKNLLEDISAENKAIANLYNGSVFFQPVYAVLNFENNDDKNRVSQFWNNTDCNFLFISSIYMMGIDVSHNSIVSFQNSVKNKFRDNCEFSFLVYKSLDISDYIIVWKSNNIVPVMEAIQELYLSKDIGIGYLNTICAINYQNLSANDKDFDNYINKINPNEVLDIANIHSVTSPSNSIDSTQNIMQLHSQNKSTGNYFVLGNDDYINTFNKLNTRKTFSLLREHFVKNRKANNSTCTLINRTSTHIGMLVNPMNNSFINSTIVKTNNIPMHRIKLFNICKNIHNRLSTIKNSDSSVFEKMDWINAALELSNLMIIMSQSDVYESVCLLLIDSVSFFCSWLEFLLQSSNSQTKLYNILYAEDNSIQSFIRSWKQLIDNIVHSDGVSIHTPGYSLLPYNIFNTVLEYYSAFFREISLLFMDNSSNEPVQLAHIISPKLCRRIKTMEMFYERRDKDSLLSLEIPISDMLNPVLVLPSLTHEAAHYCGETTRLKTIRQKIFVSSIAQIICDSLNITYPSVNIELFNNINNRLTLSIEQSEPIFLRDLITLLKQITRNILSSPEDIGHLLSTYLNCKKTDCNENTVEFAVESSYKLLNGSNSIDEHIERIGYFLKECYADLIMIYSLKLSFSDYINVLMTEFKRLNIQNPIQKNKFITLFHRVLMVRQTSLNGISGFNSSFESLDIEDDNLKQVIKEITADFDLRYQNFVNSSSNTDRVFRDGFYSLDVFYSVIFYLEKCLHKFNEDINQSNHLTNLRNMYNIMVHNNDFLTPQFHNIINSFRLQVLSNYFDDGNNKNESKFQ